MKKHRIYRHGPPEPLAPGIWRVRGGLPYPITRNMIVVRLASGGLLLHGPVALNEQGMKALEKLGRPAYAIVPSVHNQMDAPFYRARYPDLMMLCPEAARRLVMKNVRIDNTVEDILPALGVRLHAVPATKTAEYVYDVPMPEGGRMLMMNDVLGNVGATRGLIGWLFFRPLLVPRGGPKIARLFRWTEALDVDEIGRFLAGLGTVKDLRLVTVSHGNPVTEHAAARLKALAGETRQPLSPVSLNPNLK